MTDEKPLITPEQSRAARALLDWSQETLAEQSEMSAGSIRHFEKGRQVLAEKSQRAIREAFESAGVEIIPGNGKGPGVRFASGKPKGKGRSK